jgi:hypothetical protein
MQRDRIAAAHNSAVSQGGEAMGMSLNTGPTGF